LQCRMFQTFKRGTSSALLRFLLRVSMPRSHASALYPHFHVKSLVVIGAALRRKTIFSRSLPAPLQEFLQCRFAIGFEKFAAPLLQREFKQGGSEHFLRG